MHPAKKEHQYLKIPLKPEQTGYSERFYQWLPWSAFHCIRGRGSDRDNEAGTEYIVFMQFYRE